MTLKTCPEQVRRRVPLVHCITNYVTVTDVANVLLAAGASPVMADEAEEVEEMAGKADALLLNIGTINVRTRESMLVAGLAAKKKGIPVVLDPVGAGATAYRTDAARLLLREVRPCLVRGNLSEIRSLATGEGGTKGVDDAGCGDIDDLLPVIKAFAKENGCVVAVTGETDIITDGSKTYAVHNGRREMKSVTGTGCQLSALAAAFLASDPEKSITAVLAAVCEMGLAGEIAHENMLPGEGNASYRRRIIDAVNNMDGATLDGGAKYECR